MSLESSILAIFFQNELFFFMTISLTRAVGYLSKESGVFWLSKVQDLTHFQFCIVLLVSLLDCIAIIQPSIINSYLAWICQNECVIKSYMFYL